MKIAVWVSAPADGVLFVVFPLNLLISPLHELIILSRSKFAWSDIGTVLPEAIASHGTIEDLDGLEAESGSDLNKGQLLNIVNLGELFLMLVHDLVDSEPHSVVVVVERDHVVNEGL